MRSAKKDYKNPAYFTGIKLLEFQATNPWSPMLELEVLLGDGNFLKNSVPQGIEELRICNLEFLGDPKLET